MVAGLRWWIVALLFIATLINFFNRLAIAVLGPILTRQLGLNNEQFAFLTTSFLLAYLLSQGISGALYDRIGSKLGFVFSVSLWSVASAAHALARNLMALSALRFALGIGEGGMWPGAAKVITEWMPPQERALAMGICNSGTAIATVIATPLMIWMEMHFGWRAAFLILGSMGLIWIVAWLALYQLPQDHPCLSRQERALILPGVQPEIAQRLPWNSLLRRRETWAVALARFFGDPIWWFYITWLPLYLNHIQHLSMQQIALFGWLPFLAADAGSLFGGWLSGRLISSGWRVARSRNAVILGACPLMCSGLLLALISNAYIFIAVVAVVLFGFQSWIGNVQTIISDRFAAGSVASVMGLSGVAAGLGAMILTQITGFVVDRFAFTPIFLTVGLLPLIATFFLLLFSRAAGRSSGKTSVQASDALSPDGGLRVP